MGERRRISCHLACFPMPKTNQIGPAGALGALVQALQGRVSIPLSFLRDRIAAASEKIALEIEPAGRGLRIRGEAQALGAPIGFAATVEASGVGVEGVQRLVRIHLSDVSLSTSDDAPGPLAESIRTGMIDTANPATLVGNMISLPPMIVSAEGQEIVLDLMKVPAIEKDERMLTAFAAATSYVCVTEIRVIDDAIELGLGLLPGGAKEAVVSTARAALMPAVRYLWPEGRKP